MFTMKALAFLVSAFLFFGSISAGAANISLKSFDAVIKIYISSEEKQDYGRIYQLFSVVKKNQLRRENSVIDANSYVSFRRSSEARWFNFVEKSRRESKDRTVVTFTVVIEENGVREEVLVAIDLLFQGGEWRIQAIGY
ncbi:MAG: hypothetical protein ABL878_18725 [Burkholderiales bacterium]